MTYSEVPNGIAYRLIGHGPLVLVSTCSKDGKYDITPIAWNCPVNDEPTEVLAVIAKEHKTAQNIRKTGEFIVCVPHESQADMVRKTGSVSGRKVNKFLKFKIAGFRGSKVDAIIPFGCIGYIECELINTIRMKYVDMVIGKCIYAAADKKAFSKRVLAEKKEGKTLHNLSGLVFAVPGKILKDK